MTPIWKGWQGKLASKKPKVHGCEVSEEGGRLHIMSYSKNGTLVKAVSLDQDECACAYLWYQHYLRRQKSQKKGSTKKK